MLNKITGRRRTRVILVMGGVWVVAWAILGATGLVPGGAAAVIGVLLFMAVFAFGETLLQPTDPGDLQRPRPRPPARSLQRDQRRRLPGRDHRRTRGRGRCCCSTTSRPSYVGLIIVGCVAIAGLALALERRITPEVNGVRHDHRDRRRALTPRRCEDRRVRHVYECPMRWADLDMLGHVNNVVYVDYLQEARVDMLRSHAQRDVRRAHRGRRGGAARGDLPGPADLPVPAGQDRVLGHRDPRRHVHDGLRGVPRRRRGGPGGLPARVDRAVAVRLPGRAPAAAHRGGAARRSPTSTRSRRRSPGPTGSRWPAPSPVTTRSTCGSPTSTSTATSTT